MGIRNVLDTLEAAVEAITPLSMPTETFSAVDVPGATGTLADAVTQGQRSFDLGAASPPVDDGEAGAADAGSLRLRQSCVLRVAYLAPEGGGRRDLSVQISEDVASIRTALMTPANWATAPELISVEPPGVPTTILEDHLLTVVVPFDILYREV